MKKLQISFSGGRTSAFMTAMLLALYRGERDIIILFTNTGQEDDRTLDFVHRCETGLFDHPVVWLEADVKPGKGNGTGYKVVDYETATRISGRGGPFEAMIAKYGIPNRIFQHCNRELKLRPMQAFLKDIGWTKADTEVAIGIRADEIDRIPVKHRENNLVYPLADAGVTKQDVLAFFEYNDFDLEIPEHYGNCVWCWKKSLRKHLTLAKERPEAFEFPRNMGELYPNAGAGDGERVFFRGRRTVDDIFREAMEPFEPFADHTRPQFDPKLDVGGGCGESCEVYADEAVFDEEPE